MGVLDFQNHCITKLTHFLAENGDMFFKFGDDIGRFFFTQISEEFFDSPKSVRGNLQYYGDEKNVCFFQ